MIVHDLESEPVPINEMPGVALQCPGHVGEQSRGPVESKGGTSSKGNSRNLIESDAMVHVSVGRKNITGAEQSSRAETIVSAEVEQQDPACPGVLDVQAGFVERGVHRRAGQGKSHVVRMW